MLLRLPRSAQHRYEFGRPGWRGISCARKQFGECLLTALKRPAKLAFDEQLLHQIAEDSEANRVLDQVPDHGSLDTITILGPKLVAVMPTAKRSFDMDIGEVTIPFELSDSSRPYGSEEEARDHPKRCVDFRADSSYRGRVCVAGSIRRQHKPESINARGGFRWHDARQVVGVREEQKDPADREGNPILELDVVQHEGNEF